jgi:hypothetical protein
MGLATVEHVRIIRWHGGQHPTLDNITRQMKDEEIRPYVWTNSPNYRYPVRSHGYDKTLYCVQGSLEIAFPKTHQKVILRSGDRVDIPRGVRYSAIIGPTGVQCVEGSLL